MTVCSCPITSNPEGRVYRAYLDQNCEVHAIKPPDTALEMARLQADNFKLSIRVTELEAEVDRMREEKLYWSAAPLARCP